jgi:hypothetical protein
MKINKFISRFGILNGLKLFFKFRYGKTNEISLPNLKYSIFLTPNSIDNASFKEIFLDEEYNINYPSFGNNTLNIIDAGANIGLSSVFFTNKFPLAKIISFEPEKNNFKKLILNTKKYKNITPINGAILKN